MTSHVPAGGCHFQSRHQRVHIVFLFFYVGGYDEDEVCNNLSSINAMRYGAQ